MALAVPVFFLLIGIELLVSRLSRTKLYRFNDAVTNISCGIGQQTLGILVKLVLGAGYVWLYNEFSLHSVGVFTWPRDKWWSWVILFLGVDFFYYWFHRYAHEISFMWGGHVVHHQSEEYNLSVALRQGAFQAFSSWVFYLPLAMIGFHPVMFIVVNQWVTLYQFWIHTRAIKKMWWPIELIFNTPSHHRVHHGIQPKYIDKNHAGMLIIWDRMFGTFQEEEEEVVYGVTTQLGSWNPVWANFDFILWMLRTAFRCRNPWDFIQVFIRKPGWRPTYLGGPIEPKDMKPGDRKKFDVNIPPGVNYYVLAQYVMLLGGVSAFLFMAETAFSPFWKYAVAGVIVYSIAALGGLLEGRRWAFAGELLRQVLVTVSLILLFKQSALLVWVAVGAGVVALGSAAWITGQWRFFFRRKSSAVA